MQQNGGVRIHHLQKLMLATCIPIRSTLTRRQAKKHASLNRIPYNQTRLLGMLGWDANQVQASASKTKSPIFLISKITKTTTHNNI